MSTTLAAAGSLVSLGSSGSKVGGAARLGVGGVDFSRRPYEAE